MWYPDKAPREEDGVRGGLDSDVAQVPHDDTFTTRYTGTLCTILAIFL